MPDDLDDDLTEWGRSATPPVDGAFANRLETSLRSTMLDRTADGAGWAATVFRPGVVVMAIALLIFGFAFVSGDSDEVGFADDSTTTLPTPRTSVIDRSTTTRPDAVSTAPPITGTASLTEEQLAAIVSSINARTTTIPVAPSTTDESTSPGPDQTTIPQTTVPITDGPATTVEVTTIPPVLPLELRLRQDGRQVTVTWAFERADTARIAGWLLIVSVDGDGEVVASSRERSTRTLSGPLTDLDQTFRVEGIGAGGQVIVSSNEVGLSRDE